MHLKNYLAVLTLLALPFSGSAETKPAPAPAKTPTEIKAEPTGHMRIQIGDTKVQTLSWKFTSADFPKPGAVAGARAEVEIEAKNLLDAKGKQVDPEFIKFLTGSETTEKFAIQVAGARAVKEEGKEKYAAEGLLLADGVVRPLPMEFVVLEREPLKVRGAVKLAGEQLRLFSQDETLADDATMTMQFETVVPEKVVLRTTRRDVPASMSVPRTVSDRTKQKEKEAEKAPEKE